MRMWKVWLITIPLILAMICAAVCVALWKNMSSYWAAETSAAQYVLDHTPISKLESYQVFTASGVEDVFKGTDTFNHAWYAFYIPTEGTCYSIEANKLVTQKQIADQMSKLHIHTQQCTIGYVTDQSAKFLHPTDDVVFEIHGTMKGKSTFVYLDAVTGRVLGKPTTID